MDLELPKNWQGTGIKPETLLAVATDSGIPVAWVPPSSVLDILVSAAPADQMAVLRAHTADVLIHCDELLDECRDEEIHDTRVLIGCASDAFKAGHHEAAMALAVAIGESLAIWASIPRKRFFRSEAEEKAWTKMRNKQNKYDLAKFELAASGPTPTPAALKIARRALIAPIPKFFTPFYGRPDEVIPGTVSRHATVHLPTVAHMTPDNALLALMLCTSILREQQAWCEECRSIDMHLEALFGPDENEEPRDGIISGTSTIRPL